MINTSGVEAVAARHGIVLLVQFGSTVTGRTHAGSDLDLGVWLDHVPTAFEAVADILSDLQAVAPGREVDVAILNHADPLFLKRVMDEAVLVHGSPRRFAAARLYAFKRYQDYRPYLTYERAYVARHAATSAS